MSPREKGEHRPILAPLFFAESQAEVGTQNGAEGWVCEVGVAWQGVEGRDVNGRQVFQVEGWAEGCGGKAAGGISCKKAEWGPLPGPPRG